MPSLALAKQDVFVVAADQVHDFVLDLLDHGTRQVDLVDDRDDLQGCAPMAR
jgi:hypothetical protein